MSVRLSILALFLIIFLLIILSNGHLVTVHFFIIKDEIPLYYIIVLSALFGIILSFIFKSFKSYDKKMQKKIHKSQKE